MSLGKVAQSVMPPTLSEHLFLLSERLFLQSERPLTKTEYLFLLAEPLLNQSECSLSQAEHDLRGTGVHLIIYIITQS